MITLEELKRCSLSRLEKIAKAYPELIIDNAIDIFEDDWAAFFEILPFLKDKSIESDNKLEMIIGANLEEISKSLLIEPSEMDDNIDYDWDYRIEIAERYKKTISILINELLKDGNCSYLDIERKSSGAFTHVYKIGNKVLKIGTPKLLHKIPNHRRIIQPLLRRELPSSGEGTIYVEVEEAVEPVHDPRYFKQLYEIYKELRDDGLIWGDPKLANIGILQKENKQVLHNEHLPVDYKTLGFMNNPIGKPLKKGQLVIIDMDYIFEEGDPNIYRCKLSETYEERYQQEEWMKEFGER